MMARIAEVVIVKLREIEANYVALGVGIFAIIVLLIGVSIVNNFINMIENVITVVATGAGG